MAALSNTAAAICHWWRSSMAMSIELPRWFWRSTDFQFCEHTTKFRSFFIIIVFTLFIILQLVIENKKSLLHCKYSSHKVMKIEFMIMTIGIQNPLKIIFNWNFKSNRFALCFVHKTHSLFHRFDVYSNDRCEFNWMRKIFLTHPHTHLNIIDIIVYISLSLSLSL